MAGLVSAALSPFAALIGGAIGAVVGAIGTFGTAAISIAD
jgi:hypothetical protein